MNSIATWVGAIGMATAAAIYPQKTLADGFTGETFLSWSLAEQRGYLDAQIVMASSIVTRAKPAMSQCMADRFYGPEGLTDRGFEEIRTTIAEYQTFHPSSVVVVVIENNCGAFY